MKVAVIIPAYNAKNDLNLLIPEIFKHVSPEDVILINDGSTDGTEKIAEQFGLKLVNHTQNRGKGRALRSGFEHSLSLGYDGVITMDADGQHLPKYLPEFLESAKFNYSIVIGSRRKGFVKMSRARFLSNNITTVVVSLLAGKYIEDSQCGYRLIKSEVLKNIKLDSDGYQMESELLVKAGRMRFDIGHISVEVRGSQTSHIRHFRDAIRFIFMTIKTLWV